MYTITALVRCPLEYSEFDVANTREAALAVEDIVARRLLSSVGMVIVGSVEVLARGRGNAHACTVLLVLHTPDDAASALRDDPPAARAHIERQLTESMRELCRRATVERIEIRHTPTDAEWGEAADAPAASAEAIRRITGPDR